MTSEEFADWMAFYHLQPFGLYREDLRAAIVANVMANIHAKKGHSFTPKDFMPKFTTDEARPAMTADEIAEKIKALGGRTHG